VRERVGLSARACGDGWRVTTVPRLEFTINLVVALPSAVAGPLRQAAAAEEEPPVMLQRTLVVNAFAEPPS